MSPAVARTVTIRNRPAPTPFGFGGWVAMDTRFMKPAWSPFTTSRKFFASDKSVTSEWGPRSRLRGAFPYVNCAGIANAAHVSTGWRRAWT